MAQPAAEEGCHVCCRGWAGFDEEEMAPQPVASTARSGKEGVYTTQQCAV